MKQRPCVLVFAGFDPSCGAGIAADVQTITALGGHPLAVVTALTVQDNNRVHGVEPVAPELVQRQARALMESCEIGAVKIGIPGSAENAAAIAELIAALRRERGDAFPVVLDPVLASGRGDALSRGDAAAALQPLFAQASLLTPNGPEAEALAARAGAVPHLLLTGGHGKGGNVLNIWRHEGREREWKWPRLPGEFHGSGCTLASAIATLLALGHPMEEALDRAQAFTFEALLASYAIAPGQCMPLRQ
jgi:hydroxymethylpyrimidine/phosphomethylpyrimidine kinase